MASVFGVAVAAIPSADEANARQGSLSISLDYVDTQVIAADVDCRTVIVTRVRQLSLLVHKTNF